MSIVVTTPTGNIGSRVAHLLIQAGVRPTLLVRDPARLDPAVRAASEVRVVDQNDAASVVAATKGASALFWLNPPSYASDDPIGEYVRKGGNAALAVRENAIPRVVFLSSVGAELRHGAGLIDGLGQTEDLLNATDAAIVHLRPGFFFTNFLSQLDPLRQGVLPAPAPADLSMPYVDPRDIGDVVAARLLNPDWTGRQIQAVHGPRHLTFTEAAAILSEATGRTIHFAETPDDAFHAALLGMGMPKAVADGYVQMYVGLRSLHAEQPQDFVTTTPTTLGAWAYESLRPALG